MREVADELRARVPARQLRRRVRRTASPPSRTTCTTGRSTRAATGTATRSRPRWSATLAEITADARRSSCWPRTAAPTPTRSSPRPTGLRRRAASRITRSSSFGLLEIAPPASPRRPGWPSSRRCTASARDEVARHRRHAQRHADARVGRPLLRRRQRAQLGARGRAGEVVGTQRRGRRGRADRVDPRGLVAAAAVSAARWILPLVVLGSSSTNQTRRGYLYGAVSARTCACSSADQLGRAGRPRPAPRPRRRRPAPRASSGTPSTAHSRTAGCDCSVDSTSAGPIR